VGESDNVAKVRLMWEAYEHEGLQAILPFAAPDAEWRPYSADGRVFTSTAQYRSFIAAMSEREQIVEAKLFDIHAQEDCVVVSGRLRIRTRQGIRDNPMHWVHRFSDGAIVFTASYPELDEALAAAGLAAEHRLARP